MKRKIGFIFADEMEFRPFTEIALADGGSWLAKRPMNTIRYEVGDTEIIAVECGIGKVNAAFAATVLILDHQVDYVLNAGLSGAIQHLRKGDVVAGTSYIECDFDLSVFGYKLGEKPGGARYYAPRHRGLLPRGPRKERRVQRGVRHRSVRHGNGLHRRGL